MSFLTFLLAIGAFFKFFPSASFLVKLNTVFWLFLLVAWGVSEFGWNFWTILGVWLMVFWVIEWKIKICLILNLTKIRIS